MKREELGACAWRRLTAGEKSERLVALLVALLCLPPRGQVEGTQFQMTLCVCVCALVLAQQASSPLHSAP